MCPKVEVAHILHGLGNRVESLGLNTWQLRTLSAIGICRTRALGGHIDACEECGVIRISYNSCRNRHCPKCQGSNREKWIEARVDELLPVPYFHVVFTLPSVLNELCMKYPERMYGILFKSAWETLQEFAHDKGLKTGIIAVLHTWGQTLSFHPHLHCIVPGGGTDNRGKWKNIRADGKFLFSVKALSKMFRAKYVSLLRKENIVSPIVLNNLFCNPWVVFAKRPFAHPAHVIEYLGRYSHKVAISNNRLKDYSNNKVTFSYKDYRNACKVKEMTLDDTEFVRRFAFHILPKGFMKIRHYGILSSTSKNITIPRIREQVGQVKIAYNDERNLKVFNPKLCPCCGKESMVTIEVISPRGPPKPNVLRIADYSAFSEMTCTTIS